MRAAGGSESRRLKSVGPTANGVRTDGPGRCTDITRAARQLATRSRLAQGLPPKVEDPATLHRVAVLVLGHLRGNAKPMHWEELPEDASKQRAASA